MTKGGPSLNPKGRPSKLTPKLMDKILMLAAFGLPDEKIAYVVDIGEDSMTRWKTNELFSGLLQKARENPIEQVETSLFLRAKGLKVTTREAAFDATGKLKGKKIIEQELAPDTGACIAYLANKSPKKWKRNPDTGHMTAEIANVNHLHVYLPEVKDEKQFIDVTTLPANSNPA